MHSRILRRPQHRRKHAALLHLPHQHRRRLAAHGISHRVHEAKRSHRFLVIQRDHGIRPKRTGLLKLLLAYTGDHMRAHIFRCPDRAASHAPQGSGDEDRLPFADARSETDELFSGQCHQRQSSRGDNLEPLGNLGQVRRLDRAKFGVRLLRTRKHLIARLEARHAGADRANRPRKVASKNARKVDGESCLRLAGAHLPVHRVDAGRGDADDHLALRSLGIVKIL